MSAHARAVIVGPNWKNAPDWAKYCAMDGDYSWWWYEEEPEWDDWANSWKSTGRLEKCKGVEDNAPVLFKRPSRD